MGKGQQGRDVSLRSITDERRLSVRRSKEWGISICRTSKRETKTHVEPAHRYSDVVEHKTRKTHEDRKDENLPIAPSR